MSAGSPASEEIADDEDGGDRRYGDAVEHVILPLGGSLLQRILALALVIAVFLSERYRIAAVLAVRVLREPYSSDHVRV